MNRLFINVISFSLLASVMISLASCTKDLDDPDIKSTASFLIGSKGSDNVARGLYSIRIGDDPVYITHLVPYNYSSYYADINNGVIAFAVSSNQKESTSGIAYMKTDNLQDIKFVPIPAAPEGYFYSVSSVTPRVLGDGRIAYLVALETDSPYDNWFAGMVAIYNPDDGEIELSGDPSDFVLSQPEIESDTEDGTMKAGFIISPDDKYAYCEVYGYGTDGGDVHRDYSFIVRYTIGSPGSYERLAQMTAYPAAVTADGNSLLVASGNFGVKSIDLTTKAISQTLDYFYIPTTGQVSKRSSKMLRSWIAAGSYGAGFAELDFSESPVGSIHIIDEDELTSPINYYPNLALGVQYSSDESQIYFGVYRSSQTEQYSMICSTPIVELNETPDSLTSFLPDFNMNVLMFLGD